jgi:hypothetical protein
MAIKACQEFASCGPMIRYYRRRDPLIRVVSPICMDMIFRRHHLLPQSLSPDVRSYTTAFPFSRRDGWRLRRSWFVLSLADRTSQQRLNFSTLKARRACPGHRWRSRISSATTERRDSTLVVSAYEAILGLIMQLRDEPTAWLGRQHSNFRIPHQSELPRPNLP